jgi:hypothetical protein
MSIYIDLLLLALVVVYIVDLSGFTDSWRSALARILGVKALKPITPFDCSLCMTWWTTLIYAICTGHFTLPVIAYCALLSLLTNTIYALWGFINELLLRIIDHGTRKITR